MTSDPTEFAEDPVDTGITGTVNDGLTADGVNALRMLLEMPDDVTPVMLTQLARDVAQNIYSVPDVLKKHKLTQAQYEFLAEHNEFYKHILLDQIKAWQSILGTEDRVRLQTLLALEEQLPSIAGRMGRHTEELRDVVEAAKLFADISGVRGGDKRSGPVGERFTITIDLGADTVVIGAKPNAAASPTQIEASPVQIDLEGQAMRSSVAQIAHGSGEPYTKS